MPASPYPSAETVEKVYRNLRALAAYVEVQDWTPPQDTR
jgi:hypothetical protein